MKIKNSPLLGLFVFEEDYMKRKRKLIPLELQKQAAKILDIVPELQGVDDIDHAAEETSG